MSKKLSDKIKIGSFVCTVMVVYRHSLNYMAFFDTWTGQGICGWVEDGFSVLTEVAIPYFFIVSGFFFFRTDYSIGRNYLSMLGKKTRTLLLPFVTWNIVGAIALWFSNRESIGDSFATCLYNLAMSKWYPPLWYVRDLMVFMILTPIIYWLYRKDSWLFYIPVFVLLFYMWNPVDSSFLSTEGVLFFLIGGLFQKKNFHFTDKWKTNVFIAMAFVWFLLCFLQLGKISLFVHKLTVVFGLFTLWNLIEEIPLCITKRLLVWAKYSFLIYVLHLNILRFLKNLLGYYFHGNELMALLTYLLLPVLTIAFVVFIGRILRYRFPKVMAIVLGGR